MHNKMNIKKISELAGVSLTTVSFVINNKDGVSDATREKVQRIIKQEGYVPNINSRRLILSKSFNIGFLNSEPQALFTDAFASTTLNYVVNKAISKGYNVMLMPEMTSSNAEYLKTVISQHNLDGVLSLHDIDPAILSILTEARIPTVAIDAHSRNLPYPSISFDYSRIASYVTNYLIEQGHRDIGFLGIRSLPAFYNSCLEGHQKALCEANIPFESKNIIGVDTEVENNAISIKGIVTERFSKHEYPSAIFCSNDTAAIGVIAGLAQIGLSVPKDVSIISIDDIPISKSLVPALTTYQIDIEYASDAALDMLIGIISDETDGSNFLTTKGELIVRDSVRKVRKKRKQKS